MKALKAPFPYFGGKSRVADLVWRRLGEVPNYIEPFFGSGAMLLGRPHEPGLETVNDADGLLANFWRALQADPEQVAAFADWPVNENDLHARHAWLVARKDSLQEKLEGDPAYFDVKVAGWWVWGLGCWIGGEFCSGKGPWRVVEGRLLCTDQPGGQVERKRPMASHSGKGVNRKLPAIGDAGRGVHRQIPMLNGSQGVSRRMPRPAQYPTGVAAEKLTSNGLREWLVDLAGRLRRVRVCCGDWTRICGPSVTTHNGLTGVFLDPPYADTAERDAGLYRVDCIQLAHAVRTWAIEAGRNPALRIALCGYEGEHEMPANWDCVAWKAAGGYGSQSKTGNDNGARERVWFSPHCLRPERQGELL